MTPFQARLLKLCRNAVERCALDLSGLTVLTEAATGPYAATPIIAALGGAQQVLALTRDTSWGSVAEVRAQTRALAEAAGVKERITVLDRLRPGDLAAADLLTNSGHLRPIDRAKLELLKPTAVIPLMFEAWEHREGEVDLRACRDLGFPVAGTNESHELVDVFSYLAPAAAKLLMDARIPVYDSRILILCDNPFQEHLARGLRSFGARVQLESALPVDLSPDLDAILVALTPGPHPVLSTGDLARLAREAGSAVVCQFVGDLDCSELQRLGLAHHPQTPPSPGHMGILLTDIGPEPGVRLITGSLKVGEVMARTRLANPGPEGRALAEEAALASGFGQLLKTRED